MKSREQNKVVVLSLAQRDYFTAIRKNDWPKVMRLLRSEAS